MVSYALGAVFLFGVAVKCSEIERESKAQCIAAGGLYHQRLGCFEGK